MTPDALAAQVALLWPAAACLAATGDDGVTLIEVSRDGLVPVTSTLFQEWEYSFAGLVIEEGATEWELRYLFYAPPPAGRVDVILRAPIATHAFPSVVAAVHAADWHERETEDLFGVTFDGHPRLGDFVLHDDVWPEGTAPMRHRFVGTEPTQHHPADSGRHPLRVLQAAGAFVMPIGPVYAATAESAHFLLETVGEDVARAVPRLFYKYRGIEKIAEGRRATDVLLLAERFAATTAFAHGLAFSHAVERVCHVQVPIRARLLRIVLAELERMRHHVGALATICESTALVVAASQCALLEEEMLRISGALSGHRYLFGLVVPGGLATDLDDNAWGVARDRCRRIGEQLERLERMLRVSSSFLDRLEDVGVITPANARSFGLVGPIGRASGVDRDLRRMLPYGGYDTFRFDVPTESEGDGYARLRVLFAEARESLRLIEQASVALEPGPTWAPVRWQTGAALGWVEAPRGAAFHWVRLDEHGTVLRYRVIPPSFMNWLGFRLGVEQFAFQDFSIILSTLDLSVAENDR